MATSKRKTNEQIVRHMMTFSRYGALSEMFIMEAITKYAEAVSKADPAQFESMLLSGEAWVGVAKEIHATLADHWKA